MANHKEIKKSAKNIDRTRIHPTFPPSDNPIYPAQAPAPSPDSGLNPNPDVANY